MQTFVNKAMSLLFNTLSRFIIAFLPGSKHLLISWLQSLLQWFWSPIKRKSATIFIFSPSICHEVMGPVSFKADFHSPLSPSSRGSLVPLCFLPLECYFLHICEETSVRLFSNITGVLIKGNNNKDLSLSLFMHTKRLQEDTVRRLPSARQEDRSHQKPTLRVPWSCISQISVWEKMSVV